MTDDDSRVQKIPLFPLGVVLLPGLPLPLHIFEDRYKEMVAACLRQMSRVQDDRHAFLVAAGKELAVLLSGDFNQFKAILGRIRE